MPKNRRAQGIFLTDLHASHKTFKVVNSIVEQALNLAVELGAFTLFLGGDNFQSRKAQTQESLMWFQTLLDSAEVKEINVVSIVGNHDKTDYRGEASFLEPFRYHPNFTLIENTGRVVFEDLVIYGLSYFDDDVYIKSLAQLSKQAKKAAAVKKILLTHIAVQGAMNNDGSVIENKLTGPSFKEFNKVLIGHYHNRYQINDKIEYVGSGYQANFGEDEFKGCTVIYSDGSTEFKQLEFPKFITQHVDKLSLDDAMNLQIWVGGDETTRIVVKEVSKEAALYLQKQGVRVDVNKEEHAAASLDTEAYKQYDSTELTQEFKLWLVNKKVTKKKELIKTLTESM